MQKKVNMQLMYNRKMVNMTRKKQREVTKHKIHEKTKEEDTLKYAFDSKSRRVLQIARRSIWKK